MLITNLNFFFFNALMLKLSFLNFSLPSPLPPTKIHLYLVFIFKIFCPGVSKRQTITIRGTSKYEEATNTTINILLTSDKLNCRKYKKNICFWNGAVFRMKKKNSNPINLGPLSSEFYRDLCPDYYVTSYKVVKGKREKKKISFFIFHFFII